MLQQTTTGRTRLSLLAGLLMWAVALVCAPAQAAEDDIDKATVRVLCLSGFEISQGKKDNLEISAAMPTLSHGSGFIADIKTGTIVTAAHVVEGARFVAVHIPGVVGAQPAKVVYENAEADVAFLRVTAELSIVGNWDHSAQVKSRRNVFAVGYPLDATRNDAQSFKGAVSSIMPDGRIQLSMSVNPGNSGGPLVDSDDRVVGIISQGANVEAGVTGLAVAVPVASFKRDLKRSLGRSEDLSELEGEEAAALAEILVLEQSGSTSLLHAAARPDSDRGKAADAKIRGYSKLMAKHPDIAMYGAAFFWNLHIGRAAAGQNTKPEHNNALKLIGVAQKLDPNYKSTFAEFALSGEGGLVHDDGKTRLTLSDLHTVKFVAPNGVSLHGHIGQLQGVVATQQGLVTVQTDVYEKVCEQSCDVSFSPGTYQLALSKDGGREVPVGGPLTLDGKSDLHATYKSRSGTRWAGLFVMLGGSIGGTIYIVAAPSIFSAVLGGAGIVGGLVGGIIMLATPDNADIQLVPRSHGYQPAPRRTAMQLTWKGQF